MSKTSKRIQSGQIDQLIIAQMECIKDLYDALDSLMQFNLTYGRKDDAWDHPLFCAVKNAAEVMRKYRPNRDQS